MPVGQASAAYTGGVNYLGLQFSLTDAGSVTLLSLTPSAFLVTGSGEDAIQVVGGNNVLDGGTGQGRDTFFTDATLPGTTWDTILNPPRPLHHPVRLPGRDLDLELACAGRRGGGQPGCDARGRHARPRIQRAGDLRRDHDGDGPTIPDRDRNTGQR